MLHVEKWFPFHTRRLYLREYAYTDEEAIHEYAADTDVCRFTDWGPNTREETHRFLGDRITGQAYWPRSNVDLAIELQSERKIIGGISFWLIDSTGKTAEFGYAMNRRYWGNGYVTEAATAVLRRGVQAFDVERIIATCDARNDRSWRVMERLGMQREKILRRDRMQRGEWRDSYRYTIDAGAFRGPLSRSTG